MLAPVAGVTIEGASAPDGAPVARIRVSLDRAAKHRVRSSRNMILVEVDRDAGASGASGVAGAKSLQLVRPVAALLTEPKASVRVAATRAPATELRAVKAGELPNGYAITLSGNGPLVASSVDEARDLPPRVLLDFQGVSAGRAAAVTNVNTAGIERVRVATNSRDPLITRVVIDLARRIPYTIETVGEEIRVLFNRAVEASAALVTPTAPPAPVSAPVAIVDEVPRPPAQVITREVADVIQPATAQSQPSLAALSAAAPAQAAAPAAVNNTLQPTTNSQGQRTFTGDPVTLDFQGADLRAVLRTFADISGLNIVIDPSITGSVDVALRDVPWDQALDIILRANKLGYSVDGTIVRIVPLNVLAQENEERKKLADATALAGELRIITRPLSYAKAADLVPIITKSTLSSRGDVQIDSRTNTLIIRDLADRLQAASELLVALDRPQPQVEIEARIITVTRNFAQQLGISWGFGGRVDPSVGTSTGLAFPSSGVLTGQTGATNPAAPSALGLVLGSINGALDLNVQLRALENSGKLRIVSSPRVSTQNNVEAEITQGSQIPIQTVSNNTVTVTFKDAALTLKVTPQITASNTIIMRIFVEKAQPDYSETSAAQPVPAIDTQRAVTTVLVPDGDTTVIAGIYNSLESSTNSRTPFLHRIPLLGWLFKNDNKSELQDELLIFITPKILK
ncbi:MAG: type IV pilus secretin PilQ [Vicinamibacterales bacterium]|jgi:type IV pilus assembly protein PilQ